MAGTSHVLARKYRPQVFSDLIGQEALVRTITNAIANNRLAHAYMLTGIRGVGKTSSARIIAKGLNCIGPDGKGGMTPNPCGVCQHCRDIANDSHIDVIEIDAASNTGIDNVREIIEGAKYNPVSARFKIYIIDEVHMLSKQAFNALLKTLEEPPERVKFIFATTEIRKVPITILSRCQRFDLRRLDMDVLTKHLEKIAIAEQVKFEPDALKLLARAGDGSVRDSLSLMDQGMSQLNNNLTTDGIRQMLGLADRTSLFDLYEQIMSGRIADALSTLDAQYESGADPFELTEDLMDLTYWLTRLKVVPETANDISVPESERTRGKDLAKKLSMTSLTAAWQMLMKGLTEVRSADSPLKSLEMLIIRLAYLADMPSPAQILDDIKKNGLVPPPAPDTKPISKPIPTPAPKPETQPTPDTGIHDLADLPKLARDKNERLLAFQIEHFIRPISLTPGLITCTLTSDTPRDFCPNLIQFLNRETGMNWQIKTQASGGGQTLHEQKEAAQNALLSELKKTPTVSAVLTTFPGAKVEKVKPIKTPQPFEAEDIPNTDLDE
ncbi:MAG: DNA polymerase III subunit gamma/tau [Alphaproteobacteria bacterium]|nr:DNA polymerase III subunit gamma/tau [Alphaproteobacteria bacterium]